MEVVEWLRKKHILGANIAPQKKCELHTQCWVQMIANHLSCLLNSLGPKIWRNTFISAAAHIKWAMLIGGTAAPTRPVHCMCAWVCVYVCAYQNQGSIRELGNTAAGRASVPRTHLQFYNEEKTSSLQRSLSLRKMFDKHPLEPLPTWSRTRLLQSRDWANTLSKAGKVTRTSHAWAGPEAQTLIQGQNPTLLLPLWKWEEYLHRVQVHHPWEWEHWR